MNSEKQLHFISMDVPFPPNYGGIIDVFFKLKAFNQSGVKIYLHLFGFKNERNLELEKYAEEVYFYPIKQNPFLVFNKYPISVSSRNGEKLYSNLIKNKAPIFFESLKTTKILNQFSLPNFSKFLRLHNIEQNYFEGLSKSEWNPVKKKLFELEAKKYIDYEKIITQFDQVFTLSNYEQSYVFNKYKKGTFVPVFHGNEFFRNLDGFGDYILYHGDLRASDNKKSLEFLIDTFKEIDYPFLIASSNQEKWVKSKIANHKNMKFVYLENFNHLLELFSGAHINVSWSFQQSGTKLKVVNALFNSRFSVINDKVVDDKNIRQLCVEACDKAELISQINKLIQTPFQPSVNYKFILENYLNDKLNAQKILKEIFP